MNKESGPFTITEIKPTEKCVGFIENSEGIFLSSEDDFRQGHTILKPETYSFAKWLRQNKPELKIEIDPCEDSIDLKSEELWVPLVFLAQNISLPLFLSTTYDYLKYRVRGSLSKDVPVVHMRVICKNKDDYKEFKYDGPVEGLDNIKRFDVNEFMNE